MHAFWEIVASNSLVVVVLATGVALLGRVWKNPLGLHLLWLLVLVKLVTPPVVTVPVWWSVKPAAVLDMPDLSPAHVPSALTHATAPDLLPETVSPRPTPRSEAIPSTSDHVAVPWLTILAWTWAAGIVLLSLSHAWRILRFRRLLHAGGAPSPPVLAMADAIGKRLGLKRLPEIRTLPVRISPLVWSTGGPARVLLPAELFARLDPEAQEAILAHELAHVRRKDHWVRLLELAVATLFWWHPVAWWACRELRELEEQCCDGLVLSTLPHAPRAYATALLDTLDFLSERSVPVPLVATGAKSSVSLARRIKMLKNHASVVRLTSGRFLLLLALAAVPMAVAFGQKPPQGTEKSTPSAVQRRAINRLVSDFPEKPDLSTPESAMAASCRKWAREGITAALEVSWLQVDAEVAKDIENALRLDPNGPKIDFRRMFLNAELIDVLTYRDDVAVVIYKENLDRARPYGGVLFGKINGLWKSLSFGMPFEVSPRGFSAPSVKAVSECFESKKDDIWQQFVGIRNEVLNGRAPSIGDKRGPASGDGVKSKNTAKAKAGTPLLSAAKKAENKPVSRGTWGLGIDLNMPGLEPQAVQFAILDEDPVPAFTAQVKQMRDYYRRKLEEAGDAARRDHLRALYLAMDWDGGFKKVTGDQLYLLAKRPGYFTTWAIGMPRSPGDKRWIVTKTVNIQGKPVCWCIAVEPKKGEKINVTLNEKNVFDLNAAYDDAMQEEPSHDKVSAAKQVQFAIGPHALAKGDDIGITGVLSELGTLEKGDTVTVKGTCTLASRPSATLWFYITEDASKGSQGGPDAGVARRVQAGTTTFELRRPITAEGHLHLGLYDNQTGDCFGTVYFGTAEQMKEISHWDVKGRID